MDRKNYFIAFLSTPQLTLQPKRNQIKTNRMFIGSKYLGIKNANYMNSETGLLNK